MTRKGAKRMKKNMMRHRSDLFAEQLMVLAVLPIGIKVAFILDLFIHPDKQEKRFPHKSAYHRRW